MSFAVIVADVNGLVALALGSLLACSPRVEPSAPSGRSVANYPPAVAAGSSPAACQAFEPSLPRPLADDGVLPQFVGLPATRHERACSSRDFHPCDPVGPHDCDAPGWDKTWSAPLRREELFVFQKYWTLVAGRCRFIGEVRLRTEGCRAPGGREEAIEAPALPNAVDLVTGEPVRAEITTATGAANHWKP